MLRRHQRCKLLPLRLAIASPVFMHSFERNPLPLNLQHALGALLASWCAGELHEKGGASTFSTFGRQTDLPPHILDNRAAY